MEKIAVIYVDAQGMGERLRALSVPEGAEVQLVPAVSGRENLAAAFQVAMEQSDARYKVYVSEQLEVLDSHLLSRMLEAFHAHPDVGILGLSGTKQISTSGISYLSPQRVGILLDAEKQALDGRAVDGLCESVQVLDGCLLATQHDVAWRKDLFHSALFLGASASCEQRRAGHDVAVLGEKEPACRWISNAFQIDGDEKNAFLDEYSKDLYPLVSIVIPTYQRPEYFRQALESAQKQTYRNLDIFITDNSHNEETKDVYEKYFADDTRIRYEHHPDFDARGNWHRALTYDNPDVEYVNWLMDDDLFVPKKIATMMEYYFTYPDVTLVTSYRNAIDENGEALPDTESTKPICEVTSRLKGSDVGRMLLLSLTNYLGEPTTALLRKKYMLQGGRLGWTGKEGKYLIVDFSTWLCLLSQGDVVYIREPLSSFRQHEVQQHKALDTHFGGLICWTMMIREAIQKNIFFHDDEDKKHSIIRWLKFADGNVQVIKDYPPDLWSASYVQDFLKAYAGMAAALTNGYQIRYDIDTAWPDEK